MCAPEILAVTSAVVQGYAINTQNEALARKTEADSNALVEAAKANYASLAIQEESEGLKKAQAVTLQKDDLRRRLATTIAATADMGISGNLRQRLLSASAIASSEAIGYEEENYEQSMEAIAQEKRNIFSQTSAGITTAKSNMDTTVPSWLAALQIGTSAYQGYSSVPKRQTRPKEDVLLYGKKK